ncbi:MAG TPA: phage holin family protein [Streptosporangiaceae bacterium]|nr:phage holin family protein [Streptosporangiaceae bacterium]
MAEPAVSRPSADGADASVGDLVSLAVRDVTRLFQCELELAKLELRADARRVGLAAALSAIAVFTGFLVLVMLCFALAEGLITLGVWDWAAFLIVAGVCVLLASIVLLVVYLKVRRISALGKTRASVQDDLAVLKREEPASAPAAVEAR